MANEWRDKPFADWCRSDEADDRKINYTMHIHHYDGNWTRSEFTSEDDISPAMMDAIRGSTIRDIVLRPVIHNPCGPSYATHEWFAELEYYSIP